MATAWTDPTSQSRGIASAPPLTDICEPGQEPPLPEPREALLEGRAIIVLVVRHESLYGPSLGPAAEGRST